MSHFARIDNDVVVEVIVADQEFIDSGAVGDPSNWIQTSYSGRVRKHFAGIGYTYDAEADAFIAPKPYESWILNNETYEWEAPVPYPTDGKMYVWEEDTLSWVEDSSTLIEV